MRGLLQTLTLPESWVPQGTLTPEESAAVFQDMFFRFLDNEGSCRLIGEIILYAGDANPYPDLWLPCDGNERLIADYPALFDIIGYVYGAHDETHFWLPNLSLHVPTAPDVGAGYPVGTYFGSNSIDLSDDTLPEHAHEIPAYSTALAVEGGELVVIVPTEDITETGTWGAEEPEEASSYPPMIVMNYFIVAKDG